MRSHAAAAVLLCVLGWVGAPFVECSGLVGEGCKDEPCGINAAKESRASSIHITSPSMMIAINEDDGAANGAAGPLSGRALPTCMKVDAKCQQLGGSGCYMGSIRVQRGNHGVGGCCVPACDGCRLGDVEGETVRGADLIKVKFSEGLGYPAGCPQYVCADRGDKSPFVGRRCEKFSLPRPEPAEDTVISIIEQKGSVGCVLHENYGIFQENSTQLWVDKGCGATFRYHDVVKDCVSLGGVRKLCSYGLSTADRELVSQPLTSEPEVMDFKTKQNKKKWLKRAIHLVKRVGHVTANELSQRVGTAGSAKATSADPAEDNDDDSGPPMTVTCSQKWAKFLPHLIDSGYFGAHHVGSPDYAKAYIRAQNRFRGEHCLCDSASAESTLSADGFIEPLCDGTLVIAPASPSLQQGDGLVLAKKDQNSSLQKWTLSKTGELVSQNNPAMRIGVRGGCQAALAAKTAGTDHRLEMTEAPGAGKPRQAVSWTLGLSGKMTTTCPGMNYVIAFKDAKCEEGTPLVISPKNKLLTYQKWNLVTPTKTMSAEGDDCEAKRAWEERQKAKRLSKVFPKSLISTAAFPNPKPWALDGFRHCQQHMSFCLACEAKAPARIGAANDSDIVARMAKNFSAFEKRQEIDGMTVVDPRAKNLIPEPDEMEGAFRHHFVTDNTNPGKWGPQAHKAAPKRHAIKHTPLMHGLTVVKGGDIEQTKADSKAPASEPTEEECNAAKMGFPPNCVRIKGSNMDAAFLTAPEMFCTLNGQPFFSYPRDIRWINYHSKVVRRSGESYDDIEGSFNHPGSFPVTPSGEDAPLGGVVGAMAGGAAAAGISALSGLMGHRRRLLGQLSHQAAAPPMRDLKKEPGHPEMAKKFERWGYTGGSALGNAASSAMDAGLTALSSGMFDKKTQLEKTAHIVDFAFSYTLPKDFEKVLLAMTDAKVVCMNTAPEPEQSDAVKGSLLGNMAANAGVGGLGDGGKIKGGRIYFAGRIEGGCAALASTQREALQHTDSVPDTGGGGLASMAGAAASIAGAALSH